MDLISANLAGGNRVRGRGAPVPRRRAGWVDTERYQSLLARQGPQAADETRREMARLHPLGPLGRTAEVADTVAYLLSA